MDYDYRPLILSKLEEFHQLFPTYSMGEIFYSVLRKIDKSNESVKNNIREMTDYELYHAIHEAMREEKE